jgi:hypothetical protein
MGSLKVRLVETWPIYTDEKTSAKVDVAIYQPLLPDGWFFLGHLAREMPTSWEPSYPGVIERAPTALLVQPMEDDPPPLSPVEPHLGPTGTPQPLWTDQHSGGKQNIEIYSFSPIRTDATYISMGLFASIVDSYGEDPRKKLAWANLAAVRSDLVIAGRVDAQIYRDEGSGADGKGIWRDISLWSVSGENGLAAPATFVGADGYHPIPSSTTPAPYLLANVLE